MILLGLESYLPITPDAFNVVILHPLSNKHLRLLCSLPGTLLSSFTIYYFPEAIINLLEVPGCDSCIYFPYCNILLAVVLLLLVLFHFYFPEVTCISFQLFSNCKKEILSPPHQRGAHT